MGHSLIRQTVQSVHRDALRIRDKVAVHFQSDGRIAVSHVFAHRLYRDILRQKQAAIGMPQAVAGNFFHSPLVFIVIQPLFNGLRENGLAVKVNGEISFIKAVVEMFVGKPEPVHIFFQFVYERIRQGDVAYGRLCFWRLFIVTELFGVQPVAPDMYDLFVKVDARLYRRLYRSFQGEREREYRQVFRKISPA